MLNIDFAKLAYKDIQNLSPYLYYEVTSDNVDEILKIIKND